MCLFKLCVAENDLPMIHICNLCGPHELFGCESSNVLLEKMIYHKIHIYNLCGHHELYGCVSSNLLLEKMICHKIHIYDLCGLYEMYGCMDCVAFMNGVDVFFQSLCIEK